MELASAKSSLELKTSNSQAGGELHKYQRRVQGEAMWAQPSPFVCKIYDFQRFVGPQWMLTEPHPRKKKMQAPSLYTSVYN